MPNEAGKKYARLICILRFVFVILRLAFKVRIISANFYCGNIGFGINTVAIFTCSDLFIKGIGIQNINSAFADVDLGNIQYAIADIVICVIHRIIKADMARKITAVYATLGIALPLDK